VKGGGHSLLPGRAAVRYRTGSNLPNASSINAVHGASAASRSACLSRISQARIDPRSCLLTEDRDQLVPVRGSRIRSGIGLAEQATDNFRLRHPTSGRDPIETFAIERRQAQVRLARGHAPTV
jgi:hypothetical protein